MAGNSTLEITDDNFDEVVLQSDQPVLVDFWAEWCMPCKMLSPTIDEIAGEYDGRAKVGKVDVDSNRDAAMRYGITSIPTVILFKDGKEQKKFVGMAQKDEFTTAIDSAL